MRLISLLLLTLSVCLSSAQTATAQIKTLSVNESATKLNFRDKRAEISFAVENPRSAKQARVLLQLVAPNDRIEKQTESFVRLEKGASEFSLPIDVERPPDDFAFYRLRYQISAENETAGGVVAVSEIAPEVFELEAISTGFARENRRYFVRVRAVQPVSLRAVENVKITGEFVIETGSGDSVIRAETATDSNGDALLVFELPVSARKIEDSTLKIAGEKNNLRREASNHVQFYNSLFAYLQTDKPLYQPGQMLRVRTLFLSASHRAVPDADLTFVVKDPESQILQRQAAKTSRFGVASFEWQVPENAKLGEYRIVVESDGADLAADQTFFKVSRYDLPNFVVNAKPDRKFYLPDQKTAEIEIRADYLFGQPVAKGKARVVRELEREWNYKEQRFDTKEEAAIEGELDAEGKFIARFDLAKEQEDLADSTNERFKDLRFAAYVTDVSTNKTEQRRFDVRLTKEAIHVYLIGDTYDVSRRMPARFYVSAFYADGTPAECAVEIHEKKDETDDERPVLGKLLARGKTNSFGAGKIRLSANFLAEDEDDLDVFVKARDRDGKIGTHEEDLEFENEPSIEIETDKIIYKPGEPLKITVRSSEQNASFFLDVVRDGETIRAEKVKLKRGRAEIRLPYSADLRDALTVAAYAEMPDEDGDLKMFVGQQEVIFPRRKNLQIEAKPNAEILKPGEEASIEFLAAKSDGGREETALGVVVLDKAIEERARTDAEFGGRYRDFYGDLREVFGFGEGFGGVTRFHLDNLDLKQKLPADLQLAAEIMLRSYYRPEVFRSREFRSDLQRAYAPHFSNQFYSVKTALEKSYNGDGLSPAGEADLQQILKRSEIDFAAMRDPWMTPYKADFTTNRQTRMLEIKSAGADKRFGTHDDLQAFNQSFTYFSPVGWKINRAADDYHNRTVDFIRDYKTLREEMLRLGVDLNALRDSFGRPYRFDFGVEGVNFTIRVRSLGENGKFDNAQYEGQSDDFTIWTNQADYFAVTRAAISKAVTDYVRDKQRFPGDEAELKAILKTLDFDLDNLKDVYGRPYYISRKTFSRNTGRVKIETFGETKSEIKSIKQQVVTFTIKSAGRDNERETADDFELVGFTGVVGEQIRTIAAKGSNREILTNAALGAIKGIVTDPNGAVIPNVTVRAIKSESGKIFEVISDAEGFYYLANLPFGLYELTFDGASGFQRSVIQGVPVKMANVTVVNVAMEVGNVSSVVEITADAAVVNTTNASVSSRAIEELPLNGRNFSSLLQLGPGVKAEPQAGKLKDKDKSGAGNETGRRQIETPRLREYFPETLVWQPELITDANGRAELKFKLADSLTTWKIAVVGSTVDGEIGIAEKEIKAFQPFFAEHDPPKILTEGDKIALPVVLRNYLNQTQTVRASMSENSWFKLLGAAEQTVSVEPNSSNNAIFNFEAVASVKDGKQRVTATGTDASDAIEKAVSVHPHGQEIAKTEGEIFRESARFDLNFPADALPKKQRAELKIYPNLMSHVVESIEGILQRPYGCGEQTISSTYPSLLVLKADGNGGETALKKQAQKYLRLGYERLLGYKAATGGFTYWGRGEADLALTAYALRFLTDAKDVIAVDADLIAETRDFLLKKQETNGSWANQTNLTAYLARMLARVERDEKTNAALKNALAFLQKENAQIKEPYILANLALAAFDAGNEKTALAIADKLKALAKSERAGAFWSLETNTVFNGWGNTGRIEATALVLQVLVKAEDVSRKGAKMQSKSENLISKGLQFLLEAKDRYGVWYSTQTTINVLDALIGVLGKNEQTAGGRAEIFVNGTKAGEINLPAANELSNLLTFDLTPFISGVNNSVEIRRPGNISTASAQIVRNYYVPWREENNLRASDSKALRLSVNYDKTSAAIGEEIVCRAEIQSATRGYGMILAEIGLPPGADVQRESLQRMMETDWTFSRYDVLPDRIIVYLWGKPGGNKFEFRFKQRYGIEAVTAPSIAYDYYNPEAQATLAPTKFIIR
jgi:hypothetical protein